MALLLLITFPSILIWTSNTKRLLLLSTNRVDVKFVKKHFQIICGLKTISRWPYECMFFDFKKLYFKVIDMSSLKFKEFMWPVKKQVIVFNHYLRNWLWKNFWHLTQKKVFPAFDKVIMQVMQNFNLHLFNMYFKVYQRKLCKKKLSCRAFGILITKSYYPKSTSHFVL